MVTEEQDKSTDPEALGPYGGPRAVSGAPPPPEEPPYEDPIKVLTRAKFLTTVAVVTGGVMTAAILVPVVGFAVTDSLKEEEWRWVNIGPMRLFPEGQTSSIAVSGPDPDADRRVFVRRERKRHAADVEPLHASRMPGGLLGRWRQLQLPVPRRRLQFGRPGDRGSAGAPARPLRLEGRRRRRRRGGRLAHRIRRACHGAPPDDELLVGRPYSVDEDFEIYPIKGPGEPVSGVLANLYPNF